MSVAAFVATISLCLMAAISPGPAVLMAVRVGLRDGLRTGAALAAGIGLGAVLWAGAALFGLTLLFEYAPFLLTALKVGGAAFLIWTAIKMWRTADVPLKEAEEAVALPSTWAAVRLGVWTQLANPKPAIFFGAVFVGTVPEDATTPALMLLLACIFLGEFLWNAAVARLFSLSKTREVYVGMKHWIDRIFGGLLAALGVKIAAT